jgi:CBS domain-containing protein
MVQRIRDVMTADPVVLASSDSIEVAARHMKERDIGDVLVSDGGRLCGLVTDRDIVIRGLAEGRGSSARLGEICSRELVTLSPDEPIATAVSLMREWAVRRIPIIEGDRPVGIVSIGDLAVERDENSALADISAAPPNR